MHPPILPEAEDKQELERRILIVSTCFANACRQLPPTSPPSQILDLARAALKVPRREKLKPELAMARSAVWRMAQAFQTLMERRIDFGQHLEMMAKGGGPNYGTPDPSGQHSFKDFELELYLAGLLLDWSANPTTLHPPGHPFDITFGSLNIDCKHPSSPKGIAKAIAECGQELRKTDQWGAIVIGLEDVLELAQLPILESFDTVLAHLGKRCEERFAEFAPTWEERFEQYPRLFGIYFTATAPVYFREGDRVDFVLGPLRIPWRIRETGNRDMDSLVRQFTTAFGH